MAVNMDKPARWKSDIQRSVDMYNDWFLNFAPITYRETRIKTTEAVKRTLDATANLTDVSPAVIKANPMVLPTLRMATCPPLAVDRLVGLAGVSKNLVGCLEAGALPARMDAIRLNADLEKIGKLIERLADPDIFVWLGKDNSGQPVDEKQLYRAATIVADRLCGSYANPIIRNAQEQRQLSMLKTWLEARGYRELTNRAAKFTEMPAGTFAFRLNVPVQPEDAERSINIPIDAVVMRRNAARGEFPLLIEAKSAGDFTNVNKRRKEEAQKMAQLRHTYGRDKVLYALLLCGYFDGGYLGYEATEGIDWVWEHRLDDLTEFGV